VEWTYHCHIMSCVCFSSAWVIQIPKTVSNNGFVLQCYCFSQVGLCKPSMVWLLRWCWHQLTEQICPKYKKLDKCEQLNLRINELFNLAGQSLFVSVWKLWNANSFAIQLGISFVLSLNVRVWPVYWKTALPAKVCITVKIIVGNWKYWDTPGVCQMS